MNLVHDFKIMFFYKISCAQLVTYKTSWKTTHFTLDNVQAVIVLRIKEHEMELCLRQWDTQYLLETYETQRNSLAGVIPL